jgi:hypothetical protein
MDYQCRCTAIAYWQELVDEADTMIAEYEELDALSAANIATMPKTPHKDETAEEKIKELVGKITSEQEAIELGGLLLDKAKKEKQDIFVVMGRYRKFGTPQKHTFVKGSYGKNRIEDATQYYPRDWAELSIKDTKTRGLKVLKTNRGYYTHGRQPKIALSSRFGCELHEMAHRMEALNPKIVALEKDFYERRTKGESPAELNQFPGYSKAQSDEKVRKDKFADPYMGKDYGGIAYEILAMGIENLKTKWYNTDVDYDAFVVGVLAGVK